MTLISVDGVACGPPSSFTLPLTGCPWADLTTALPSTANRWTPGQRVSVEVQDGPKYNMTVERSGPHGGFTRLRLVGGTGGLGRDVEAKFYRDIPARTVLREILEECGEVVGDLQLDARLPLWVRQGGPAHEAVRALMGNFPEFVWRMTPEGKVNVDAPTWPEHERPLRVDVEDASTGTFHCDFTPGLLPGQHVTLTRGEEELGKRVTRVTQQVVTEYAYPKDTVKLRTIVGTGDGLDVGVNGLARNIRRVMQHTDYHAVRPAVIIRDHGDHTVDVQVLEAGWPELVRVPLLVRVPGVTVKVKASSPAALSFVAGNPAMPFVELQETGTVERYELVSGQGAHIVVEDDRGQTSPEDQLYQRPFVQITDQAGQFAQFWAERGREKITLQDRAGTRLVLDGATGNAVFHVARNFTVTAGGTISMSSTGPMTLHAPLVSLDDLVNLAGGLLPVARDLDPASGVVKATSAKVRSG